jgi:hypothetical protein
MCKGQADGKSGAGPSVTLRPSGYTWALSTTNLCTRSRRLHRMSLHTRKLRCTCANLSCITNRGSAVPAASTVQATKTIHSSEAGSPAAELHGHACESNPPYKQKVLAACSTGLLCLCLPGSRPCSYRTRVHVSAVLHVLQDGNPLKLMRRELWAGGACIWMSVLC